MRRTVSRAICAFILLAFPAFAAEKVDLVRVHKAERRLELIGDGKVVRNYGIALGGDPVGHKHQEGDQRTPEGRYILDWRNPNSIAYKSIHVSYPDAGDLAAAKARNVDAGGMIMIHGQPNGLAGGAGCFNWSTGPTVALPLRTRTWTKSGQWWPMGHPSRSGNKHE